MIKVTNSLITAGKKVLSSFSRRESPGTLLKETQLDSVSFSKKEININSVKGFMEGLEKYHFPFGLNKNFIQNLENLSLNDFFTQSRKFIANAMEIPETLLPNIIQFDHKKSFASFYPPLYQIQLTSALLNSPKATHFALLTHEMVHLKQHLHVLRTQGLGEKAADAYAREQCKILLNTGAEKFLNIEESEITKMFESGQINTQIKEAVLGIRNAAKEGKLKEFLQKLFDEDLHNYQKFQNLILKTARDTMGTIKENSFDGKLAAKYYTNFLSADINKDINGGIFKRYKYQMRRSEIEAYLMQYWEKFEYSLAKTGLLD